MAPVTGTERNVMTGVIERLEARRLIARAQNIDAAEAARFLPYAIGAAALASLVIVGVHRWRQSPSEFDLTVVSWASVALLLVLAVVIGPKASFALPRGLNTRGFTAYILSLEAGILLLPGVAFSTVWKTRFYEMTGWTYPVVNKRWLVGLYVLSIVTLVVFPAAVDKWLRGWSTLQQPVVMPPPAGHGWRRWISRAAGIIGAVLLACYFAGPPWHIDRVHRPIDTHEQVHLGPLQAIDKGYLPYIGPASTQYGPGSQVLTYAFMKATGRFDIVSFREADVARHFVTFAVAATFAFLVLGFWSMLLIVPLMITFSPLTMFQPHVSGIMVGFYGWGNALRYLGAVVVVPTVVCLARRPRTRVAFHWPSALVGALWGFFAWVSQENLGTTLLATSVMLAILWFTDTSSVTSILTAAFNLIAGFAAFWLVVLAYYGVHGQAIAFVRNYFLVASAVAMGFSNAWWPAGDSPGYLNAYYFTGPLLIALAVTTICDVRTLSLRTRLDEAQTRFLAFVCVALFCYQAALFRSDSAHLVNTMLALPFVLVLATRDAPAWLATTWPARALLRTMLVALFIVVYPISAPFVDPYAVLVAAPAARFQATFPNDPNPSADQRIPFKRAGRYLADEPAAGPGMVAMRTFLEAASEIRDLIGTRRTFVDGVTAGAYTGLWFFLLDLTPGPVLFERETMIINNEVVDMAFEHFQQHVREFDAIIAPGLGAREVRLFLAAHPDAVTAERHIGRETVYVLLSGSAH
jgi:hypothetical protein